MQVGNAINVLSDNHKIYTLKQYVLESKRTQTSEAFSMKPFPFSKRQIASCPTLLLATSPCRLTRQLRVSSTTKNVMGYRLLLGNFTFTFVYYPTVELR